MSPQEQRKLDRVSNDVDAIYELLSDIQGTQREHGTRLESVDTRLANVDARLESVDTRLANVDAMENPGTNVESAVEQRLEIAASRRCLTSGTPA
jgi:chromosome segregation ATPase